MENDHKRVVSLYCIERKEEKKKICQSDDHDFSIENGRMNACISNFRLKLHKKHDQQKKYIGDMCFTTAMSQ